MDRVITIPELIDKANATFSDALCAKLMCEIITLADELDKADVDWVGFHRQGGDTGPDTVSPWELVVIASDAARAGDVLQVSRARGDLMRTLHEEFKSDSSDDADAPEKPDIIVKTEGFLVRLKRKMGIITEPK